MELSIINTGIELLSINIELINVHRAGCTRYDKGYHLLKVLLNRGATEMTKY